jgi:hypothetical protein
VYFGVERSEKKVKETERLQQVDFHILSKKHSYKTKQRKAKQSKAKQTKVNQRKKPTQQQKNTIIMHTFRKCCTNMLFGCIKL